MAYFEKLSFCREGNFYVCHISSSLPQIPFKYYYWKKSCIQLFWHHFLASQKIMKAKDCLMSIVECSKLLIALQFFILKNFENYYVVVCGNLFICNYSRMSSSELRNKKASVICFTRIFIMVLELVFKNIWLLMSVLPTYIYFMKFIHLFQSIIL